MDNICHTLTGAALGKAGLASRTRFGMATMMVAANLPDLDVAVFFTDTLPVSFRRGWTHGVLAQVALPIVLAGVMWAIARTRPHPSAPAHLPAPARTRQHPPAPDFRSLLLLSYIGVISHVFMDFLNSYGVRLLMPFSGRWFYGDALYIVDPWLYLVLGGGVWLASRAARAGAPEPSRPARRALMLAGVYMVVMLASNLWARSVVRDGLARAGRPPETRFMVTPVVVNPFRREVLVDTGDRYEKGFVWFEPHPTSDPPATASRRASRIPKPPPRSRPRARGRFSAGRVSRSSWSTAPRRRRACGSTTTATPTPAPARAGRASH